MATGAVLEAFKAGTEPGSGFVAKGDRWGSSGASGDGDADDGTNAGNQANWGLY